MFLSFGYLYKFVMFYFIFFQKGENNRLKKTSWPTFCNITFLFLLKIGSIGPADQPVNLVSPVNKTLRHEIMKRSKFKNKANKTKNLSDVKNYKKQRNYVVQSNK